MPADLTARIRAVLDHTPIVDGHNDLLWELRSQAGYDLDVLDISQPQSTLHTDLPRLRLGGVGVQFWSVFVPATLTGDAAVAATLEQIDAGYALCARYSSALRLVRTADEVDEALAAGRIASLLGMEGGHSIACSLGVLRQMAALGVRYLTLTHGRNVPWADSATDVPAVGGLTAFGAEVVREMNRLGMLVDLSHVSADTMRAALRITEAPAIFSHSSAYALCPHPRNIPDDVLAALPANGGVAMVTFVPPFLRADCGQWWEDYDAAEVRLVAAGVGADARPAWSGTRPKPLRAAMLRWVDEHPPPLTTVSDVADHVEHVRAVAGVNHVGLGGDLDGVPIVPDGLSDVAGYPTLLAELAGRGWSDADLARLAGRNTLRVLRAAEDVARDLRTCRGPSFSTITDLDGPGPV